MRMKCAVVLLSFILLLSDGISKTFSSKACPLKGCNPGPIDGRLNLHLVPHSHDDVGWIETVEDYYTTSVNSILDTMVEVLLRNETYRFTYVEMAFFQRWWKDQSEGTKANVQTLVHEGRLQFALGGWVMADEATVYYSDQMNQLTRGRVESARIFGDCDRRSRVAWQIDTFGHSIEHASLFYQANYDALFLQRMHYTEKEHRRKNGKLEFLWNVGGNASLFTHVFNNSYCYVNQGCMDPKCSEMEDTFELEVEAFVTAIKQMDGFYQTDHLFIPMGCDFSYENATRNFRLMDRLIQRIQGMQFGSRILNAFYSTPDCYIKAVAQQTARQPDKIRWTTRTGDMLPYADREHRYWTGFYTSRPALKAHVRQAGQLLTVAEQLGVFVPLKHAGPVTDLLRQESAILQHHDAITGTEKKHVAADYFGRLLAASQPVEAFISTALTHLGRGIKRNTMEKEPISVEWIFCRQLNISICEITSEVVPEDETYSFTVGLYNPLSWTVYNQWLHIPLRRDSGHLIVTVTRLDDEAGKLNAQMINLSRQTRKIPERENSPGREADTVLIFSPTENNHGLAPLSFTQFRVQLHKAKNEVPNFMSTPPDIAPGTVRMNGMEYSLQKDTRGVKVQLKHLDSEKSRGVLIEMLYYEGSTEWGAASGAYIFRPEDSALNFNETTIETEIGLCMTQMTVTYADWASLVVRLYNDTKIEVEWTVGPIPDVKETQSKEIIVRYTTSGFDFSDGAQAGTFYTDSAGRHLIRRVREKENSDPIASNYHPVVNRILLKEHGPIAVDESMDGGTDSSTFALAIYTDRTQGGTSLEDGQIELMVHRRLVADDNLGVEEALMENGENGQGLIVRGVHRVHVEKVSAIKEADSRRATEVRLPLFTLFKSIPEAESSSSKDNSWTGLEKFLPNDIHLLTFAAWPFWGDTSNSDHVLLRLENLRQSGISNHTEMRLGNLFQGIRLTECEEMILTADELRVVADAHRFSWDSQKSRSSTFGSNASRISLETFHLKEGTIATLICHIERLF